MKWKKVRVERGKFCVVLYSLVWVARITAITSLLALLPPLMASRRISLPLHGHRIIGGSARIDGIELIGYYTVYKKVTLTHVLYVAIGN